MDELIKTFHIDWKLLIAQAVNFTIVLAVLYFFALKPIMKIMNDRTKKIEGGLKNAELMQEKLQEAEEEKSKAVSEGRKQAQIIINKAEKESEQVKQEKLSETKTQAEKIIQSAKQEIDLSKKKMMNEVKSDLAGLVLLASNKISENMLDQEKQKKLIDNIIKNLEKQDLQI